MTFGRLPGGCRGTTVCGCGQGSRCPCAFAQAHVRQTAGCLFLSYAGRCCMQGGCHTCLTQPAAAALPLTRVHVYCALHLAPLCRCATTTSASTCCSRHTRCWWARSRRRWAASWMRSTQSSRESCWRSTRSPAWSCSWWCAGSSTSTCRTCSAPASECVSAIGLNRPPAHVASGDGRGGGRRRGARAAHIHNTTPGGFHC